MVILFNQAESPADHDLVAFSGLDFPRIRLQRRQTAADGSGIFRQINNKLDLTSRRLAAFVLLEQRCENIFVQQLVLFYVGAIIHFCVRAIIAGVNHIAIHRFGHTGTAIDLPADKAIMNIVISLDLGGHTDWGILGHRGRVAGDTCC